MEGNCDAAMAAAWTELQNWLIPGGADNGGEVNSAGSAARRQRAVADQLAVPRHVFHCV